MAHTSPSPHPISRVFTFFFFFFLFFQERYSSFDKGIGAKIEKGTTSLEELEVCEAIFFSWKKFQPFKWVYWLHFQQFDWNIIIILSDEYQQKHPGTMVSVAVFFSREIQKRIQTGSLPNDKCVGPWTEWYRFDAGSPWWGHVLGKDTLCRQRVSGC